MLFPKVEKLKERLDARFRQPSTTSLTNARNEVTRVAALDWAQDTHRQDAMRELKAAVALLESAGDDERVGYLRNVADLQVSKGSGLLAFSAIVTGLAAGLFDELASTVITSWLCGAATVLALLASILTLCVVWSSAPGKENFATPAAEADWLLRLMRRRANLSNWAVILAGFSSLLLAGTAVMRVVETLLS